MDKLNPPPGGDQDRGSTILGVTWTLTLIALIFVCLRMYSRVRLVQKIWWDDWLAVAAIVCAAPLPIIWIFYVNAGGARHVFYLTMQQQSRLVRLNWMSQPFGVMAIGIAKASVAFSILRFQAPNKWRTRLLYFIALSINVVDLLVCIFMFVQCSPARALWSPELATTARCWNPKIFEYYSIFVSSYGAALDFVLVFISTTIIWNLKLSVSRRIQLAALLGTGVLDGVFGIVKATKLTAQSARSDYTWNTFPLFIWTIAELHGIIIGCCLPTLRPLYLIVFRRPGREAYTKRNQGGGYGSKGSYQLSQRSKTRQARSASAHSDEGIIVPGIRHMVDLDVTYEHTGQASETPWTAKPGNATAVYSSV